MTNPHLLPLALQEISSFASMTHFCVVTADHLTQITAAALQTIKLGPIPPGTFVHKVELRLVKPFKDASDAAFNSTTVSVGDTAAVGTFIAAQQVNENGTEITLPVLQNTPTGPYAAADQINLTVNSMAAKSLVNIDVGELHILVQLFIPKVLSDVKALSAIANK